MKKKNIMLLILIGCIITVGFGMYWIGGTVMCNKSGGVIQNGVCQELNYLGVCALKQNDSDKLVPAIYNEWNMEIVANDTTSNPN